MGDERARSSAPQLRLLPERVHGREAYCLHRIVKQRHAEVPVVAAALSGHGVEISHFGPLPWPTGITTHPLGRDQMPPGSSIQPFAHSLTPGQLTTRMANAAKATGHRLAGEPSPPERMAGARRWAPEWYGTRRRAVLRLLAHFDLLQEGAVPGWSPAVRIDEAHAGFREDSLAGDES